MIMELLPKFHILATYAMFFFIVLIVLEEKLEVRAILLLPIVLLWFISKVLYTKDLVIITKKK